MSLSTVYWTAGALTAATSVTLRAIKRPYRVVYKRTDDTAWTYKAVTSEAPEYATWEPCPKATIACHAVGVCVGRTFLAYVLGLHGSYSFDVGRIVVYQVSPRLTNIDSIIYPFCV